MLAGEGAAWLAVGAAIVRVPRPAARTIMRGLRFVARRSGGRLNMERWARLAFPLGPDLEPAPDVTLEPVTDVDIGQWRQHPDRQAAQLQSAHRFWVHGLRHAWVYRDESETHCTVWMLTKRDNAQLRRLPDWAGMYPPLALRQGQLENLFVFSNSRRAGIGLRFVRAVLADAAACGLTTLFTHISERNGPACAHATRVGWRRYGTIVRFTLDLPVLRALPVYVHLLDDTEPAEPSRPTLVNSPALDTPAQLPTGTNQAHAGMFAVRRSND